MGYNRTDLSLGSDWTPELHRVALYEGAAPLSSMISPQDRNVKATVTSLEFSRKKQQQKLCLLNEIVLFVNISNYFNNRTV